MTIAREPETTNGSWCITGAYVITADRSCGDIPAGHVHVTDGTIVAVDDNTSCTLPGRRLDGARRVVLPGLIDTHWHLWNILIRGLPAREQGRGYFAVKDQVAPLYRPIDSYRATRLALAEAHLAGITTVNNWNHNTRSPEDADANIRAHRDMGGRARFTYGFKHELPNTELPDLDDILRIKKELAARPDRMLTLGMCVHSPNRAGNPEVYRTEWAFARDNDLTMTFHCSGDRDNHALYANLMAMYREGLTGPDLQVVHATRVNAEEIAMLAETGTHISVSPFTEVRSMGAPPLTELLDAGVLTSLSIDNFANPTPGDMFLQMRGTYSIEKLRRPDSPIDPRRMLELATIDGARDLGFDDVTGSLVPGKRADLLVVDTRAVNLTPCPDPVSQVVLCATPQNLEYVICDGEMLVDHGRLCRVDEAELIDEANESQSYLLAASGWSWPYWDGRAVRGGAAQGA